MAKTDDLLEYHDRQITTSSSSKTTHYFKDFLLRDELNESIKDIQFEHPSDVQQQCIPKAILGCDILAQAKSGTGKTAVFVLSVLQQIKDSQLSCVCLVHTKELAQQVCNEFKRFVRHFKFDVKVEEFYGGVSVENDLVRLGKSEKADTFNPGYANRFKVHSAERSDHGFGSRINDSRTGIMINESNEPTIFIGTPGRTLDLLKRNAVDFSRVKHFVMDEVDELLVDLSMRKTVQDIFFHTPVQKQTMLFTATLNDEIKETCLLFLKDPHVVIIDEEKKLTLHGLQQFFVTTQYAEGLNETTPKFKVLENIIDNTEFNQMVIFVRDKHRAKILAKLLRINAFPAIEIHSGMDVKTRLESFLRFKNLKERILIATNLMARGIDVQDVNVVVNFDMPECAETYLHRVGRAGRFETKGIAISLLESPADKTILNDVQARFEVSIKEMALKDEKK
ncbi:hypothetical protein EDEG_01983 [Edhazardia aedis USNM 41457]|uniref:RNA helicase n=1 Tax=Edhazardia aedis (strain USNM 41457) TaxID=1003232 RepID=J9DMA2_EDHAE|nr:hypothetical protein EDEG_01983 [Edhazardia aedis USNM 41457]|eukprot:EJW03725.1 hypothetical protein EDEG_01983 [Edhazardia aedis USNM 41457]